jgi:LemA protein
MTLGVIIALAAGLPLLWFVATYNRLVRIRQHVHESWADIDTELKRRYDLIPNLVETVRGYAAHERELLAAVTDARTRAMASHGSPGSQAADEQPLVAGMRRLLAVAEDYPDLKASDHFLELQRELARTEDRIQRSRRFYNGNVRELNSLVQEVPSNVVARAMGFTAGEYFEVESSVVRSVVDVSFDEPAAPPDDPPA